MSTRGALGVGRGTQRLRELLLALARAPIELGGEGRAQPASDRRALRDAGREQVSAVDREPDVAQPLEPLARLALGSERACQGHQHVRRVELTKAVIVGSVPTDNQVHSQAEPFTIVISKPGATVAGLPGNPLTACVNRALAALTADGTLQQITDKWITSEGAPELK